MVQTPILSRKPVARSAQGASKDLSERGRPPALREIPPKYIVGATAVLLGIGFVVALVLKANAMQPKIVTTEREIELGGREVLHEPFPAENPIVDVYSEAPEIVAVDPFLHYGTSLHLVLEAKAPGQASVVLRHQNGDRRIVRAKVPENQSGLAKTEGETRMAVIQKAIEKERIGDEFWQDLDKNAENYFKAWSHYTQAIDLLKTVRLYHFLPEYHGTKDRPGLKQKEEEARRKLEEYYTRVEKDFELARELDQPEKARQLLLLMLRILSDPNDARYLKNRTFLEFVYR